MKRALLFMILTFVTLLATAKGVYLTTDQFLELAFTQKGIDKKVEKKSLWLDKSIKQTASAILDRPYHGLRVRYWVQGSDTAWILEEIGKEKPITIGVHIHNNAIASLRVLEFRESRGGEVRHSFFTEQFDNISLTSENRLDAAVDSVTGATLSVWAVKKIARLALYFHQLTPYAQKTDSPQ